MQIKIKREQKDSKNSVNFLYSFCFCKSFVWKKSFPFYSELNFLIKARAEQMLYECVTMNSCLCKMEWFLIYHYNLFSLVCYIKHAIRNILTQWNYRMHGKTSIHLIGKIPEFWYQRKIHTLLIAKDVKFETEQCFNGFNFNLWIDINLFVINFRIRLFSWMKPNAEKD